MNAEEIEDRLRRWCVENGHPVSALNEVSEQTSAALIGVSAAALRLWLDEGRSPLTPTRRYANRRWYRLDDIACFLAQSEQNANNGLDP
ncbi:MerR family transcriptional regulator [Paraburkholderia atlantica]|uniref:MerR family transcriptional regulator n=1 Tax=Paraburkholderia atlantica TaxID=2654982 RepID=UPI003D20970E